MTGRGRIEIYMTGSAVSTGDVPDRQRAGPCETEPAGDVLAALVDPDCQCILSATTHDVMTASELSEACDIPQSTLYRKLELLETTGLIEERVRLNQDGKHPSEYHRVVGEIVVDIGEDCAVRVDAQDTLTV